MKKKTLVERLSKFIADNSKKYGDRAKALEGMIEDLKIKSPNLPVHWVGVKRVPAYHEEALEKFLSGKGY